MWILIAKLAMRFFGNVAGAGYLVLNTVRAMNIITLLTVIGASGSLLVKTFTISGLGFFSALTHILRILLTLLLILSELNFFKTYFARNWPLFSPRHGFVTLGFAFLFLGVSILGELAHRETRPGKISMPFWQLALAAGILSTIMAIINILTSYIFRDSKNGVTARQVRTHGAAAASKLQHTYYDEEANPIDSPPPNRATRYREFFLSKDKDKSKRGSLPSYESTPSKRGMDISSPISAVSGGSAKYERYPVRGMQSPESAKHPAERHGNMI